jgi:hypothetical protein
MRAARVLEWPRRAISSLGSRRWWRRAYGLRHEVREEARLQIAVGQLTGVYKKMVRGVIALAFRCKTTGGSLVTTDETADYRLGHRRRRPRLADEAYAIRVLDALHSDHAPAVREHDGRRLV